LVQRLTALFLGLIFLALAPPNLLAQGQSKGSTTPPPKAKSGKIEGFFGASFAFPPVSVVQQVVYCPVQGSCSVPATIDRNRGPLLGWEGSAAHHFGDSFALSADVTGNYGLGTSGFPHNAHVHQYTFLAGPQFYLHPRRHLDPFVHVLFGATHQSVSASGNSFFITFPSENWGVAAAAGGGIDAKIGSSVSFRLIQADYVMTHLGGNFQSQPRVSAGLVIRF
jgi:hypothetical protein